MHDSRMIANKLLNMAGEKGNTLTPMQLLKLVYIAHGWMLGLYGLPLIRDRIEAWKYGPVIPRLYHAAKGYEDNPILDELPQDSDDTTAPVEDNLLEQVYNIYGKHSGIALSNLTHKADTPWDRVYKPGVSNIPIPNDIIEEHYQALSGE